jgi:hydrogenase-4 component F
MEATTLASAPLIIFKRTGDSLEAMWKYILLCSVGIGFALFGTMLLAVAGEGSHAGMDMNLLGMSNLNPGWFKAAFVFILAGYGTKMGLAPFQAWMPDAYSEAPGVLSVLSSGGLLACSFLGVVRVLAVAPAEVKGFCVTLMLILGVFSLALAAFFILRQSDYKRMLAYSSMEHMGLCAVLWALGLEGVALIHIVVHALLKVVLFMTADNIQLAYSSQKISSISGLLGSIRRNAVIYLVGVLMLCGMPPSPLFVTELLLIKAANPVLGAVILLLLFIVFAGMTSHVMNMCMGKKSPAAVPAGELKALERLSFIPGWVLTVVVLSGAVLITGIIAIEFKLVNW